MQLKHVLYALITAVGASSQCSGTCDAKSPGEHVALVQRHAAKLHEDPSGCSFEITATPSWYGQVKTYEYHGPCDTQFEAVTDEHAWCGENHELNAVFLRVKGSSESLGILSCANQDHAVNYGISENHEPEPTEPTPEPTDAPTAPASWAFAIGADDNLVSILKGPSGSGKTEVHVLSADNDYKSFHLQTGTGLGVTNENWDFVTKTNGDLVGILKGPTTGSGKTEVHILSAADNYQSFTLQTGTALGYTDNDPNVAFAMRGDDLVCIKKQTTGSGMTEVHILSGADNYQSYSLQKATGLGYTDDNWDFVTKPNGDLVGILKGPITGSGMTEVHILSSAGDYQSFALQKKTALPLVGDTAYWQFAMKSNGDLVCILKGPKTGSGMTEVHVLSAADEYQSFSLQTGTALATTW